MPPITIEKTLDEYHSSDQDALEGIAYNLSKGLGSHSVNDFASAWLIGQNLGRLPEVTDFRTVYNTDIFSPTVYVLCRRIIRRDEADEVEETGADLEPVREFGERLREIDNPRLDTIGRYILDRENVHPDYWERIDEILGAFQPRPESQV